MHIDAVSIFPQFFDVLDLSLIGKAQQDGLLSISRTDLRDYTEDRHRTVDDSPPVGGRSRHGDEARTLGAGSGGDAVLARRRRHDRPARVLY